MSVNLPLATVDTFVELVQKRADLTRSVFSKLISSDDAQTIISLGQCKPDPVVYDDERSKAFVLWECRGGRGHFGMATLVELNDDAVERISIVAVNKIEEGN